MTFAPDPDEEALFAEIAGVLDGVDTTGTLDVTQLSTTDLLTKQDELTERLIEIRQLLEPQTAEGRELHSQRSAVVVELHRRRSHNK